ncbi:hypothetical protein ACHM17_08170 [Clostridium perfringens]|uniref:hypothetical protein n=1 Tax=Clostridium perfringens TaxID=1502 RepID=UPI0013E3C760|nr:hypothetical protein [Clostridium perfringens]MBI6024307.1 hypothetical protein [Clostridium perfringens]MBI6045602.1 hypothetical protein [Clostridium perfringens]MBI6048345.1 hypothetical protein [Clostridium perfringens]MCX0391752.1 hypothetical protein [Clostridium perfringens]MDJ8927511.1 hypothetical protein [Clostridium perfringens]
MNINEYFSKDNRSFKIDDTNSALKNVSMFSLKIALNSYFKTYLSIMSSFELDEKFDEKHIKYEKEYIEAYIETIVHFQHFFELIIKDILEKEHILLSVRATNEPVILHKLVNNEQISQTEYEKLYSIEFSDALKSICKLLDDGRINREKYGFIKQYKLTLEYINTLRNRIWHKGKVILTYRALDELVCKYILPIVKEVISLDEYIDKQVIWKPKDLIGIDINLIDEMIVEMKKESYDLSKLSFLKEAGRAGYNRWISEKSNFFNDKRLEELTDLENKNEILGKIEICPVCGKKTLCIYQYVEEILNGYGVIIDALGKCINCNFTINRAIKDLSEYGYDFNKFWETDIFTGGEIEPRYGGYDS